MHGSAGSVTSPGLPSALRKKRELVSTLCMETSLVQFSMRVREILPTGHFDIYIPFQLHKECMVIGGKVGNAGYQRSSKKHSNDSSEIIIHAFSEYFSGTYHVPGPVLGVGGTAVNGVDTVPILMGLTGRCWPGRLNKYSRCAKCLEKDTR